MYSTAHQKQKVYYICVYSVVLPRNQVLFETFCFTILISGTTITTKESQMQTVSHF